MKFLKSKYKYVYLSFAFIMLIYLLIPIPKLNDPTSTVIYSKEGRLLGAKISDDEQWRFPILDSVPAKFAKSIILFEDRYFLLHPGFNPVSLIKASILNIKANEIISGGSTITMQVIRLARKGKTRTIKEKIIEIILATKLELKYSKKRILAIYASNAPFGSNVIGLEAASWRYFGRDPNYLSWAETATLAVLPNSPALIYPGKNQQLLKEKRNKLLLKLLHNEVIDSMTYKLSIKEKLPGKPKILPQYATHLLNKCIIQKKGQKVITTIDFQMQLKCNEIVENQSKYLIANEIHNASVLIIDVKTGRVKTYIGNTTNSKEHGNDVDIIVAPRSSGSILKPLLYAAMLNDGEILPNSLVPDIPLFLDGFSPKNYNLTFDGVVPAKKALSRSLNVPSVFMLSKYGIDKFYDRLNKLGFSSLNNPPDHYGLSLILGGAEVTLWDLCKVYSNLARVLNNSVERHYKYSTKDFINPIYYTDNQNFNKKSTSLSESPDIYSCVSIWFMLEALLEVNRPENESGWKNFSSSNKIAWKTGTSFGFRDAWAIGISPNYVVGVWVGNSDGEGRPGLTGVTAAAPILFDIFDYLNVNNWFEKPYDEIIQVELCKETGFLPSINCGNIDTFEIPEAGLRTLPCPYHKLISTDKTENYRVNVTCAHPDDIIQKSWFVLPPVMEYYYKFKNPQYKPLPQFKPGCNKNETESIMQFIYPNEYTKIYIPIDYSGTKGKTVFEVAHRNSNTKLFWHIDNEFIGTTTEIHQMAINPKIGCHIVTVIDNFGNYISQKFEIVSK